MSLKVKDKIVMDLA